MTCTISHVSIHTRELYSGFDNIYLFELSIGYNIQDNLLHVHNIQDNL